MKKRKIYEISVIDRTYSKTISDETKFYTSDTALELGFELKETEYNFESAEIVLLNIDDRSLVTRPVSKVSDDFLYELDDDIIPHYGEWRGQVRFEQAGEVYVSSPVKFRIENDLSNERPPQLSDVQSWVSLKRYADDLIDELKQAVLSVDGMEDTFNTNEVNRQSQFESAEQSRQTTFETNESERDETFNANEATRQENENARIEAEKQREGTVANIETRQTFVENQFNSIQQELTDKDVISAPEIIAARNGEADLKTRLDEEYQEVTTQLAQKATQTDFNANDYGADPSAIWTVNRDAFQAANDAAFANGGGRVVAPPGEYLVKGIIQDSNVEFNLPGVTFKNPDGTSPNVISARTHEVNGSVNKDVLTVDDTSHFSKGSSIIIQQAGGILDTQFSSLSSDINSTTTSISLAGTDNRFPRSGYMQVGNELISYTSMTGTTLNGVKRGQLGTSAQNHSAGDFIGVARHFYTEVSDIDGNDLILSEEVPLSVSDTLIEVGAINPAIRNLTIDGNKIPTGHSSSVYGIGWSTVRWGNIQHIRIKNGDMGGLILSKGTTESVVDDIVLEDCGVWDSSSPKGAGIWVFQGSRRNSVNNITVTGKGWVGIYIDDRTTIASPYDAPSNDNYITNFIFDLIKPSVGSPPAFAIVGSNRNKFTNGFVRGTSTGVEIDHGRQRFTDDDSLAPARDNEVAGVHFDVFQPWILRAPGNRLHDSTYTDRATSIPIVEPGNLTYAVTTTKGDPIEKLFEDVKFQNGTANSPGISFANEPNTGFYRDATGVIRTSINGQLKYSFYGTEFRLADGVTLATGTSAGTKIGLTANQKIGFFGKTPMSQPSNIVNLPTDATLGQMRDTTQMIIVTLRNLGLIGS